MASIFCNAQYNWIPLMQVLVYIKLRLVIFPTCMFIYYLDDYQNLASACSLFGTSTRTKQTQCTVHCWGVNHICETESDPKKYNFNKVFAHYKVLLAGQWETTEKWFDVIVRDRVLDSFAVSQSQRYIFKSICFSGDMALIKLRPCQWKWKIKHRCWIQAEMHVAP